MFEQMRPALSERTTLHLGGHAIAELWPENLADLELIPQLMQKYGGTLYPLGRGSNVLAKDGDLPLVLLRLEKMGTMLNLKISESEDNTEVIVQAGAGVSLRCLMRFCLENGLSGLEGMVGIPGTLGGAVAMNAGSFGSVIGKKIKSITVWSSNSSDGKAIVRQIGAEDLMWDYRQLKINGCKELPIILAANLSLTRADKNVIFKLMCINFIKKKSRQPLKSWSAGSAFKNPPGDAAARLLDSTGFRGRQLGGMAFSPLHANFLINTGTGTAAQALELIELGRRAVFERYGIGLELEIKVTPCQ